MGKPTEYDLKLHQYKLKLDNPEHADPLRR